MANRDPKRVLYTEKAAGQRASFHVYYRNSRGKLKVEPAWTETAKDAKERIEAAAHELRTRISVVEVVKTEGGL